MMPKNVLGLVYSNSFDGALNPLTARRTMGSVPFGGRYRLIDFELSNLVNSGVTKVGVFANLNFRSLMDHIGSGRSWDLSRKVDGLVLLPPFSAVGGEALHDSIDTLSRNMEFIARSKQEYVLLMYSNFVCNMDLTKLFDFHTEKNADVTIVYAHGKKPALDPMLTLTRDGDRITDLSLQKTGDAEVDYSANMVLMSKALMQRLVADCEGMHHQGFEQDILQANVGRLNMFAYKAENKNFTIDSMQSFFDANMALLDRDVRRDLFSAERPVYTKVRNDMPVVYGLEADAGNSLIADGCVIEGTVKNSVLFRGVRVAKGAVVENSILMQDAYVGEDARLNCVIMDKNTVVTPKKTLSGDKSYPLFVGKEITI